MEACEIKTSEDDWQQQRLYNITQTQQPSSEAPERDDLQRLFLIGQS